MAEYKLSYTAKEIDEKLGKVDTLVASVNGVTPDENGNVNISVGSGEGTGTSVQADYNQNDSTAADYIKNRPFYIGEGTPIFDEDVTTELLYGVISYEFTTTAFDVLTQGTNLTVEFNGTPYSCSVNNDATFGLYIGNGYVILSQLAADSGITVDELVLTEPIYKSLAVDTGEPFAIFITMKMFATEEAGTHHFKVIQPSLDVNNNFKTFLQCNYSQNDPMAFDYIKNRPFYSSREIVAINNNITNNYGNTTYGGAMIPCNSTVIDWNSPIDITWDDVVYSLTGTIDGDIVEIGNISVITGTVSDGEVPFYIGINGNMLMIYFTEPNKTHSLSMVADIVQKFSSRYIDWDGGNAPSSLPEVTTADNDKVLMVVDGSWVAGSIANGDEVAY